MSITDTSGIAAHDNFYNWVPARFKYLVNNTAARLSIRKNFYRKYGKDVILRDSFLKRIIRCLTRREGLGISELEFLSWEIRRTVLNPRVHDEGGSLWWRNVNLRFIITSQIAAEIVQGKKGNDHEITNEVNLLLEFI